MVKHTQTIRRLSAFDHFVGLALKGLKLPNSFDPASSIRDYNEISYA